MSYEGAERDKGRQSYVGAEREEGARRELKGRMEL